LRIVLEDPQVASINCNDCWKHVYNLDSGTREEYDAGGVNLPIVRMVPPPCDSCPRGIDGQPDFKGVNILHRRNYRAFEFFKELQATYGAQPLPKHLEQCAVFAENMATIARVVQNAENRLKARAYDNRDK
jgi:hypothetical protein